MSISKELTEALDRLEHAAMGYAQDQNMHTSRRLTEAREAVMLKIHPSALITSKQDLEQVELYRLQLAGIMSAAIGYWNEGDRIQPDYDTVALRDVAKLYDKYVEAVQSKDGAYEERNRLVALLCSLLPAVRCKTAIEGWSEDWHGCVYLTLPNGQQASWHYHDSQAELFAHVPEGEATWDGHTTPEKYQRIAACCAEPKGQLTQDDIIELARRFDVYLGSPEDKLLAYSWHLLSLHLELAATQGEAVAVHIVATGMVHEGQETYTRHEGSPPPLCDFETLYTATQPAAGVERSVWKVRYYGSPPDKGYNIFAFKSEVSTHGDFIANVGEDGDAAEAICAARNNAEPVCVDADWLARREQASYEAGRASVAQPEPQGERADLSGCACRWDKDDNRVHTCERHQGWLDVVHEWAERAKAAEREVEGLKISCRRHASHAASAEQEAREARAALLAAPQADELRAKGWVRFDCPVCGSDGAVAERPQADELMAQLDELREAIATLQADQQKLRRIEAAIKIKGGNEHYPTEWAYLQACKLIDAQKEAIAKKDAALDACVEALLDHRKPLSKRTMQEEQKADAAITQAQEALK